MILRDCNTCDRRTDHDRRQWAEPENMTVVIRTEYTCNRCGDVDIDFKYFPVHERETHGT